MNRFYVSMMALYLGGCSSLSGYDSQSKFSCKAPDGVSCSSLSGVYANAVQNNLPGLQPGKREKEEDNGKPSSNDDMTHQATTQRALPGKADNRNRQPTTTITGTPLQSGDPIHVPARVLRVWIAPWEDEDGDLHDQSYVYMLADYGRWMIEHNRQRIIDDYRPTTLSAGTINQESAVVQPDKSGSTGNRRSYTPLSTLPPDAFSQQAPMMPSDVQAEEDLF